MALFKQNKKETESAKDVSAEKEKTKTVVSKTKASKSKKTDKKSVSASKPRIQTHVTEKANVLSEKGVYVFKVKPEINKIMMRSFIKKTYGVEPVKIGMINSPSKTVLFKRRRVVKPGHKKAVVYLKKGDKISVSQ